MALSKQEGFILRVKASLTRLLSVLSRFYGFELDYQNKSVLFVIAALLNRIQVNPGK